jgi:ribonuclease HII
MQTSLTLSPFDPVRDCPRSLPLGYVDRILWNQNLIFIGLDEVGRGPLAGPVTASAVILPPDFSLPGLNDSKKLTADRREEFYEIIAQKARAWSVQSVEVAEIEKTDILAATFQAMRLCLKALPASYGSLGCLVDGKLPIPGIHREQVALVKGDSRSLSIAAASVMAKVTRDRLMDEYDLQYPHYGFKQHKGYGTSKHREAIAKHGLSPIHRPSFCHNEGV